MRLSAAGDVQLDKNNSLELELSTGWNVVSSCEVKIKSATGGLRLLISEATVLGAFQPVKTPEGGSFTFSSIPADSAIRIRFPFSTEQDLLTVAIKVDVTYTTERGTFVFQSTPSAPIALALGVNVQDVFKHDALFSRFTVSTATESPLRLYKSELLASKLFESHFWACPGQSRSHIPKTTGKPALQDHEETRDRHQRRGAEDHVPETLLHRHL